MLYLYLFISFFVTFVTFCYILSLFNNIVYKVPQVSTFSSDLSFLKRIFDSYELKWKNIADLWSWIWKMLRFFEKNYSMNSVWFEIDFSNVLISRIISKIFGFKNKVFKKDYLKSSLSDFDFIYVYLFPSIMDKLEKKLWSSCKKWTVIFVNAFKFENHKPLKVYQKNWKDKVFVYVI